MRRAPLFLSPRPLLLVAAAFLCAGVASAETKVDTVLTGLNNPTAVAIQPETGAVFVAESFAGNVVRVTGGKAEPVITGWRPGGVGPLSLAFFDKNALLVGDGGFGPGADCIRVFALPEAGKTTTFDMPKEKLGPLPAAEESPPEGIFYGLAATKFAVFATGQGDSKKGWLVRSEVNGTKYGELKRFAATVSSGAGLPAGLTISPRGEVVVGQIEGAEQHASRLAFYNANNGKQLLSLDTGLSSIMGLAYAPKTGFLYALGNAGAKSTEGGLYRLDSVRDGEAQKLVGTKIIELARPTALAFAPDGTLYLIVLGPTGGSPAGQLLKIAPGL